MTIKRIETLLKSVNTRLQPLLDFDGFYAVLYDPLRSVIEFPWVMHNGQPVEPLARPYQPEARLLDSVIQTGVSRLIEEDFEQASNRNGLKYELAGTWPQSWLGVPLIVEGRAIGVLAIENGRKSKAFGENGVRVLSSVARQTAIAIENARLVDQRDRKIAHLRALYEMGQQLNSGLRLSEMEIVQLIYTQASKLMDTRNLYIALYNETTDEVSFPLMYVDGQPTLVPARHGGKGRTEWIIQNRQPIFNATRTESDAWYRLPGHQEYIGQPFASWVGVPMMVGDRVLGVIATYQVDEDYAYSTDDQDILQLLANQAAVAIENSRLFQQLQNQNARIAEMESFVTRGSIAADLVHRMNNLAGTIPVRIDLIREQLESCGFHDVAVINGLEHIDSDTINLLRAAEQIKQVPQKENIDIITLLRSLVRQASIQRPAKIEFQLDCTEGLLPVQSIRSELNNALWSIMDNGVDAMPNGGKMTILARNITGATNKERIEIQIKDEGGGIPQAEIEKVFLPFHSTKKGHLGYGLWRAKQIIESNGGSIEVSSNDRGTTFTIRLPVSEGVIPNGQ